ncbi:hypothetical protein ElyMa_003787600 [Elysia marginata]|uniref:Uncharacterized protein n=1 Tax=Elysia marginata TaxID=1093978 RepID=A0AAV4FAS6_9GAST|nr:hypothetical protein ElyMa_003787600 [Elysia marginata]
MKLAVDRRRLSRGNARNACRSLSGKANRVRLEVERTYLCRLSPAFRETGWKETKELFLSTGTEERFLTLVTESFRRATGVVSMAPSKTLRGTLLFL